MRFGICCGPGSFIPQESSAAAGVAPMMEALQAAGADYVEFTVGAVMPEGGEREYEQLRTEVSRYPLQVEAFNSFIPATHRITGPEVDLARVLEYCGTALTRCRALGAEVVVLGSAGARRVPDGFDPAQARRQFVEFCRELGPLAEAAGIEITIEPLNRAEDNLVNSVDEGARLADEAGHPHIRLLADFYHMFMESEDLTSVVRAGDRLGHTHCADLGRVAPGYAPEGEADFVGFFKHLKQTGFDRRCSFEGSFTDIASQSGPLLQLLRDRWSQA